MVWLYSGNINGICSTVTFFINGVDSTGINGVGSGIINGMGSTWL